MRSAFALLLLLLVGCGGGGAGGAGGAAVDEPDASADDAAGKLGSDASALMPSAVDAGDAATFTEIYAAIFPATTNARCNFCHSMPASDTSNGKLSVGETQASAYSALVGKVSSSSQCADMPLVKAGAPDASLFLLKLIDPAPCGSHMPLGGMKLSDAVIEQVRSWIAAGAKND